MTKNEKKVLKQLFLKTIIPIVVLIVISSAVLFFGFYSLLQYVSFATGSSAFDAANSIMRSVQFVKTYVLISAVNLLVLVGLSITVIYISIAHLVLPVIRITHEIQSRANKPSQKPIAIRQNDEVFVPLVEALNQLFKKLHK